ncbi:putative zinc-binding metallopeptidase [Oceanicola sp. 22II-s10i]|uniref:zinc-binding metallopeptidase family protein n=1 Tax=Oceanicola sp. 22II-s10i TaxID=1317116 RepID=UPI000B5260AF|nr:putative zinc-binding metallopeptidase [Oceanicola sp. 22II-s10i]
MRIYSCTCGAPLFIDNTQCTSCGRAAGWCESCEGMAGFDTGAAGDWTCATCGTAARPCANYSGPGVCNRTVRADDPQTLCRLCGLNDTVPNLEVDGNRDRWARLEAAKRRLIYTLDLLGLPYGTDTTPPLRFSFLGDGELAGHWVGAETDQVLTGHAEGLITVNIREADDAAREQVRVDMGEAHRTLIGHLRHEIGHYYWDLLIRGRTGAEQDFATAFGDPNDPPYDVALDRHYADGPPPDWEGWHVSAYATMHPWEDWAETFALWLAMAGVLDTAQSLGIVHGPALQDTATMVEQYRRLGLAMNELTREMGLLDFAPVVITPAIEAKLKSVDWLMRGAAVPARDQDAPGQMFPVGS